MSPFHRRPPLPATILTLSLSAALFGCSSSETASSTLQPDASVDTDLDQVSPKESGADSISADAGKDATADQATFDGPTTGDADASDALEATPEVDADGALPEAASEADAAEVVSDPSLVGPFAFAEHDGTSGSTAMHCAVPESGPSAPPYPIVLFAHGFMIEPFRYYESVAHLASYGYVACTVGYSSLSGQDQDPVTIVDALDWAIGESAKTSGDLSGKVDSARAGVMGHSRGGKAAVNAAAADSRFLAVLGIDPVNTCPMGTCPDAIVAMATLSIPSGFVGETTDDGTSGGGGQACAPAADNFQKFYTAASSPSLSVNVIGANHMSFVDDVSGCLQCNMCKAATADRADVLEIARGYMVAFFERRLRGTVAYDTWLDGAMATQKYGQSGRAVIESK